MGFFKAYDMRGAFGIDFDLDTVYRVGLELPSVVGGKRWLVGRDCRESSDPIRDALVRGLTEAGASVADLGLSTTPMVYFFTAEDDFDGSVMITASHNPASDNGLKVSRRGALPVGYADGLDEIERRIKEPLKESRPEQTPGCVSTLDGLSRYLSWMRLRAPAQADSDLRFAVDCSSGMASLFAHQVFPNAIVINDEFDGKFRAHSPNPLKAEAREQLSDLVRLRKLDFGLIFDGDADRCMFVDETGAFVQPDYLIPIVARATMKAMNLSSVDRVKVIHDVRTSRGVIDELRRMGCEPVMVPVGHAFAKPILRECGALCGGELAGHYYFGEFHFCDSGLLTALRVLSEVSLAKLRGETFSQMVLPISGVYANSGEINFRVEDKDAAIGRVLSRCERCLSREVSRCSMDGIRVEYERGWLNVRKSNTEPYLRLVAEFMTADELERVLDCARKAIEGE